MTTIEELTPEYFDMVAEWLSRPDINRWLNSEWRDRQVTNTLVAVMTRNNRNRLFIIKYEGEPCGLVGLGDIDRSDRTAMIWCVLGDQRLSGLGISTEALVQVARFAFTKLALASIYSWLMEDNARSYRMIMKAGFREVGRVRQAACSSGRQVDRIYIDMVPGDLGL